MSRSFDPKGKIVRRFGVNIFGNSKFDRLLEKRPTPPGPAKKHRPRLSEYGKQLVEKQVRAFLAGRIIGPQAFVNFNDGIIGGLDFIQQEGVAQR